MTRAAWSAAAAWLVLLLAACATTPDIVRGEWIEVRDQPVAAMALHETCVRLEPGDRLEYAFSANQPVGFNVHYHEGKVVVAPVTRERVRSDEGRFDPVTAQEYCLMWEAGPIDTLLAYRVRVLPRSARR